MSKINVYLLALVVLGGASFAAPTPGHASALYKWRDEQGTLHYGDAVPPSYALTNREVINDQGITLKSLPGRKTRAQQQAEARKRAARKAMEAHRHADQVLLDTYTSVEDIQQARDNRLTTLRSQIHVTSGNIGRLERRVAALETRIGQLGREAGTAREKLARQLKEARMTLLKNRRFLQGRQHALALTNKTFSADIARFKQLRARD